MLTLVGLLICTLCPEKVIFTIHNSS